MNGELSLDDVVLQSVGATMVQASSLMVSGNQPLPAGELPSLTGIGGRVTMCVQGFCLARAALADAAKTGGEAAATLMTESAELDAIIAHSLGAGFSVPERGSS